MVNNCLMLFDIVQAITLTRLLYAYFVWWRFANVEVCNRLNGLLRKFTRSGFLPIDLTSFEHMYTCKCPEQFYGGWICFFLLSLIKPMSCPSHEGHQGKPWPELIPLPRECLLYEWYATFFKLLVFLPFLLKLCMLLVSKREYSDFT